MGKKMFEAFTNIEEERQWAESADKAMQEAIAKGDPMAAEIPGYGIMGELRRSQIKEMVGRMQVAARLAQARIDALDAELARRDAAGNT